MEKPGNQIIEMTLDGEFVSPPPPPRTPVAARIMIWAAVAAVIGGAFLIAAVALWFVTMILPFVLGAAAVAYLAYRYQVWRARQAPARRPGRF